MASGALRGVHDFFMRGIRVSHVDIAIHGINKIPISEFH
jgi:hypothetical protein